MKKVTVLYILWLIVFSTGCDQKFLEVAPDVALDEAKVFSSPVLAAQFADNAYSFLPSDYLRFGGTGPAQASDEAVGTNALNINAPIYTLNKGLFHQHTHDTSEMWTKCYGGIRVVNKMLSKIDEVEWGADHNPQRIKGEMYYLRAFFYFELLKRFGSVVIVDKAHNPTDDIDFPRNTYEECVAFIIDNLSQAVTLLPVEHDPANYGRPTLGAALALKSRTLLYAASPLHNPESNVSKWQAAASAAKEVMDLNLYTLHPSYDEILSPPGNGTSSEYILIKVRGPRAWSWMSANIVSPGSGGGSSTVNPTQNHVDLYEMQNGMPIGAAGSGYDPAHPYQNRDPRFYSNILYNDAPWQGRKMEMWNGGKDYSEGTITYSATRYYCRKLWPEIYQAPGQQTAFLNYIFYRYGEILLNYAEAQNEAAGPDAGVYNAINQLRRRAGMPDLPEGMGKDAMRDRIQNERAVELAFEDHRWYDIMRWKRGVELINATGYGMNVERLANGDFTYTKVPVAETYQKVFEEHMHLYPIPRDEVQKSKHLVQNPGW